MGWRSRFTWRRVLAGAAALGGLGVAGVAALVGWAASQAERKLAWPDTPYPDLAASTDPGAVERGRYLVHGPAHCIQCHTATDRNHPEQTRTEPLHGGFAFEMGPIGTLYARNLTPDPATGIGRRSDAELARVLRTGVLPEGDLSIFMRFSAASLSDGDISDVIAYLRSVAPVRNEVPPNHITLLGRAIVGGLFPPMAPRGVALAGAPTLNGEIPAGVPAGPEPTVERGRYLADHVMLCTGCHTPMDPNTFAVTGPKGAGGTPEPSHGDDAEMEFAPPNLTSHPTGVTGRMDEDAFVARILAGRTVVSSIMPWEGFQQTTEVDLRSVYRYLKSLPPIDADTGPPYRPIGWTP